MCRSMDFSICAFKIRNENPYLQFSNPKTNLSFRKSAPSLNYLYTDLVRATKYPHLTPVLATVFLPTVRGNHCVSMAGH